MRAWSALGVALLLLVWAAAATRWPPHVLPGPGRVLLTAGEQAAALTEGGLRTFRRVLAGYSLAVAAGLGVAALGGRRTSALDPVLAAGRTIPPFAWTPLLLLWLGIGDLSAVLVVAWGAFFPIARMARHGLAQVPEVWITAARNLGVGDAEITRRVVWLAALPDVVAGLRLGWAIAWMSVVAAELVGADGGWGQLILDARNLARPDVALAGMACIGLTAGLSELAWGWAEARLLRWRP